MYVHVYMGVLSVPYSGTFSDSEEASENLTSEILVTGEVNNFIQTDPTFPSENL